ncbi:unnamed protein product [Prorocentrum cordatum]|uniref:PDZ domain-containing protein n=1 Tax=Prorocentrum cordatum TaxID=2364126 RepID=A0ABN9QWL2_9DINO|nr:unnamed protein product [Polarella glacialis]
MLLDPASFQAAMAVPGMREPDELIEAVSAGSTKIEVQGESSASYKINDRIKLIGAGGKEEVVTVAGFEYGGGVVVEPPLEYSYEAGDRVEFVESTTTKRTTTTYTTTTKTTTTFTTTTAKDTSRFSVVIDKGDAEGENPLGADLGKGDGVVLINELADGGFLQKWNDDNPKQALQPGDKIVEANGISKDADQIMEELLQSKVLKLVVKRDPPKDARRRLLELASSLFV